MKLPKLPLFTAKRVAVTAVALAASLVVTTQVGQADTGITLSDANTFMVSWNLQRLPGGTFSCSGTCLTQTAARTYRLSCPINLAPQASPGACLTALAAACVPSACASP
ncbi:MAG TPA: hypothetical protein VFP50_15460 [Anaeromyxobacteraceae bacterium]|nr:hypothetical protein [Anaeromyxobacteraceae bacterium]